MLTSFTPHFFLLGWLKLNQTLLLDQLRSETEVRRPNLEVARIDTGIVLVPCRTWKCVPTAIFGGVDISEVPGCHLLRQMSPQ